MVQDRIAEALRRVPDFPKPGIVYIDITPLLQDSEVFAEVIDRLAERYQAEPPKYVAAIDARGFIFGGALALKLGCGFIPIRKKGKLPYKTVSETYSLEYGESEVEIHIDAVKPGERVVLVDDLLATGGTAAAAARLLDKIGADIAGVEFIIELGFLDGRKALGKYSVNSLFVEG